MSEPTVAPESAPARRRLLIVVGGLVLVAVVGALALAAFKKPPPPQSPPSEVYDQRLREAVAEVDRADPRWHFAQLVEDRAKVPIEENGAPIVMASAVLIPENLNGADIADLRARLRSGEIDGKVARGKMVTLKAMLGSARKLAGLDRGRHGVSWDRTNPFATQMPHLVVTRDVVDLLTLDAEVSAHEGRLGDALVSTRAALIAARAIGDEPMPLSQFKRLEWQFYAVQSLEEVLRRSRGIEVTVPTAGASTVGWMGSLRGQGPFLAAPAPIVLTATEARLLGVQKALEAEAAELVLRRIVRAERAGLHAALTALEDDKVSRAELPALGEHGDGTALITTRRPDTLKAIHAWLLDYTTKFAAVAELPSEEQEARAKELAAATSEAPPEGMPLVRALTVADTVTSCHKGQAMLGCGAVGMALERYRLDNGAWPDTLAALAPKYLKEVPTDPFDGKPLRYLRLRDGVVVYSVGSGGKEVVGAADLEAFADKDTGGIGFRLWNVAARGQKK
jgi:hypothetical protein